MTANEGDQKVFTCSATGIPAPEITWLREGSPFNEETEPRVMLQSQSVIEPNTTADLYRVIHTLTLTNTQDGDSGNYTCVADNINIAQQNATFTFELFVRGMTLLASINMLSC